MRVIYCAGEEGRVVADVLRRAGVEPDQLAFLDDDETLVGDIVAGVEVVGGRSALDRFDPETDRCIVAFGDRRGTRLDLAGACLERGFELFSAVDPAITVSDTASLGDGVIVNAESYVGPDARVEDLVLIDSGVSVSHDVVLGRGATIGPGVTIAGGVTVGSDALVAPGATLTEDVSVGDGAVVGAGAVLLDDVAPGSTVVGVPAEPVQSEGSNAEP